MNSMIIAFASIVAAFNFYAADCVQDSTGPLGRILFFGCLVFGTLNLITAIKYVWMFA